MALPYKFTGGFNTRSRGVIDAIERQIKFVTLKPAKKLTFSFNPFHEKVSSIRSAAWFLHQMQVRETNINCTYKTEVHNSSTDPTLKVKLVSGKDILFKTANLTALEILEKYNQLISVQHHKIK